MKIFSPQFDKEFECKIDQSLEKTISEIQQDLDVHFEVETKILLNSRQIQDLKQKPSSLSTNSTQKFEIQFFEKENLILESSIGTQINLSFNIWNNAKSLGEEILKYYSINFAYNIEINFNGMPLESKFPLKSQNIQKNSLIQFKISIPLQISGRHGKKRISFDAFKTIKALKEYLASELKIEENFELKQKDEIFDIYELTLMSQLVKPDAEIYILSLEELENRNEMWKIKLVNAVSSDEEQIVEINPYDQVFTLLNFIKQQSVEIQFTLGGINLDLEQTFIDQDVKKDSIIRYFFTIIRIEITVQFKHMLTQVVTKKAVRKNDKIHKNFLKVLNQDNVSDNEYTLLYNEQKIDWDSSFADYEITDEDQIQYHPNNIQLKVLINSKEVAYTLDYNSQINDLIFQIKSKPQKEFYLEYQGQKVEGQELARNYWQKVLTLIEQNQDPINQQDKSGNNQTIIPEAEARIDEVQITFQLPNNKQLQKKVKTNLQLSQILNIHSRDLNLPDFQKIVYINDQKCDQNLKLQEIQGINNNNQVVIRIEVLETINIKLKNLQTNEQFEKQVKVTDKIESLNAYLNLLKSKFYYKKAEISQNKTFAQAKIMDAAEIIFQAIQYTVEVVLINEQNQQLNRQFLSTDTIAQVRQNFNLDENNQFYLENKPTPLKDTDKIGIFDFQCHLKLFTKLSDKIILNIKFIDQGKENVQQINDIDLNQSLEELYNHVIKTFKFSDTIILKYEANPLPRNSRTLKSINLTHQSLLIVTEKKFTVRVQDKKKNIIFESYVLQHEKIEILYKKLQKHYKRKDIKFIYKDEEVKAEQKFSELSMKQDVIEMEVQY